LRAACGRKAKAIANERFDWEREKNKYIAAYQRLGCAMTVTSTFEKEADV